ncbi:MAG: ATP-binding cassette domain-containing protein [Rhizobiaceae bacterium]|nr:ATP-binding cassette domain-containing protein [Rhizobiaceae bacterium]
MRVAAATAAAETDAAAAAAVSIEDLRFRFSNDSHSFALEISSLKIEIGERVALVGPSGSGKSTLLGLICGILTPSNGSINVFGQQLEKMSGRQRDKFRADTLGVIFQQLNLLPYLSVLDNVILALEFSHQRHLTASQKQEKARYLLDRLGLGRTELAMQKAAQLSVGQQQRVAAARAFVGAPPLIIADEPTSALDEDRQSEFVDLLFSQQQHNQATLLMVTHNTRLAARFDRVLELADLCNLDITEGGR